MRHERDESCYVITSFAEGLVSKLFANVFQNPGRATVYTSVSIVLKE
jgi:hypothetical protein